MGSEKSDVVILGGGVIGLACANELVERGRSVTLLERGRVGSGASHGNCGLVTPSHCLPLHRPGLARDVLQWMAQPDAPVHVRLRFDLDFLAWSARFLQSCDPARIRAIAGARSVLLETSRTMFAEMVEAESLEVEWETLGVLEVFATDQGMADSEAAHGLLAEHGIETRELDRGALLELEPALRGDVVGGRHFVNDAHLRPNRLVAELERLVRAKGVRIEEDCEVHAIERDGACASSLRTDRGPLATPTLIVAAGAWSPKFGRALGVRLPVQPGKGYSITYGRPDPCPRQPLLLAEANMAVTPWGSGYRLGGTMELSGYDSTINRPRLDALRQGAARYLREPEGTAPEEWAGWRPMTPDELPILDRVPGLSNAYLATGHGMMGVSMAPATGRLVAELVTGEATFVDRHPYSLARFT